MFGYRFAKFQPSEFIIRLRNGKVVQEGVGLSFFYYAPRTSVMVMPASSIDVPFMFEEKTRDFQTVTVQGQLTYRIAQYAVTARMLDYTYDLHKKQYLSDDPSRLAQRVINLSKVVMKKQLEQMLLKEAVQSSVSLATHMHRELEGHPELEKLGLELIGLSILAVLPNKETMRALEAQAREQILRNADEALYERRNASIQQERIVKENELSTEIAIEEKKKQIREAQLNMERTVMQLRNEMQEEQLKFDTEMEKERLALIELSTVNKRAEADAKAYELSAVMRALEGVQGNVLHSLTNMGMKPDKLMAIAFQELAENAGKIGQLTITPDLLQGIAGGGHSGGGDHHVSQAGSEPRGR